MEPTKPGYGLADVACPFCVWGVTVEAVTARLDQAAYEALWEHVQAAHYNATKSLRTMSLAERRTTLKDLVDAKMPKP